MTGRRHSEDAWNTTGFRARPAAAVVSRQRGGTIYPNALSFSRSLVRKLLRQGWRIEKLRTELDDLGRGEACYRLEAGRRVFHFLAISNVFPQSQKVDRSFGVNWDISAAICEGDWTPDREAALRINIPLQRAGRFDHDVLAFARGNRSERMFDQIVDALAQGVQPDAGELAGVGYVFRTTGFHSNGAVGMRPYAGIPDDHPLRQPYHAQILLALLMRDFVFDLVDHLARVKGGDAAEALDLDLKRYLGIGNSAGLGLIPYLSNHALLLHRWSLNCERARAEALDRVPGTAETRRFLDIVERAIEFFREDPRDGNDIFASCALIAEGLNAARVSIEQQLPGAVARIWADILPDVQACGHGEVREILESVLLECYPDIVTRYEAGFEATEHVAVVPQMPLSELRARLEAAYDWLLRARRPESIEGHYFWYAPQEAPNEPRRGRRGVVPSAELESKMDAPLRALQLARRLEAEDGSRTVADFLASAPEFRSFVGFLQALDDEAYAVFQDNTLAEDFVPFSSMRFVLAFYGMEKLDPRLPRSVKGAFLQGAPLLADIEQGKEGMWPFALLPRASESARVGEPKASSIPLRLVETPEADPSSLVRQQQVIQDRNLSCRMSSSEIFRTVVKALQTEGLDLGTAEMAATAVVACHASGLDGVGMMIDLIERSRAGAHGPLQVRPDGGGYRLNARHDRPLSVVVSLLDHAGLSAHNAADGRGIACATGVSGSVLLSPIALFAARRHGTALLTWTNDDGVLFATAAWRTPKGVGSVMGPLADARPVAEMLGVPTVSANDREIVLGCGTGTSLVGSDIERRLVGHFLDVSRVASPDQAAEDEARLHRSGTSIENAVAKRFLALGERALIPPETEQLIR